MTPLREIVKWLSADDAWLWVSSDRWLAELVVRVVEERAKVYLFTEWTKAYRDLPGPKMECELKALLDPDIDIAPEQFREIKNRLKGDANG